MYQAYLSYAQLKEYLSMLLESGLLEYVQGEQKYRTTTNGIHYLNTYQQIGQMIKA